MVQPLLCSLYLPECHQEGGVGGVELIQKQLCTVVRTQCSIVDRVSLEMGTAGWPGFMNCDNSQVYRVAQECRQDGKRRTTTFSRFNESQCMAPHMVPTNNEFSYYQGVDGCGLRSVRTRTEKLHLKLMVI